MKKNKDFIQLEIDGLGMDVYIHIDVYDTKLKGIIPKHFHPDGESMPNGVAFQRDGSVTIYNKATEYGY